MAQNFGPANARLTIRTGRKGAASKAGHDLLIEVGSWQATLDPEAQPALTLTADSRSFRVLEGTGGVKSLDDDDKANIAQTIDDEVLKGRAIEFRSTQVERRPDGLSVTGELTLGDRSSPVAFELALDNGRLTGGATVKQTDFGIKPYTALFGALKVADEVRIGIDAKAPPSGTAD
jgi:polyisoprenoid-binding protein YceI